MPEPTLDHTRAPQEHVLVVDDDVGIAEALSEVVSGLGYRVTAHTDPREAVRERDVDVIVTDQAMPHLTGVELLRQLRDTNPGAVRVMVTAASDIRVAMQAVNEGEVFRLVPKPWSLGELRSAITEGVAVRRLARENERLTAELRRRNEDLEALNRSLEAQVVERTNGLLEGMVRALDFRDTETQWHSWRVAAYARRLAQQVGVPAEVMLHVEQGALLHDIGKIGVRDSVLRKTGPLDAAEWAEMREHPSIGFRMLRHIPYLRQAAELVHQHQERWDGSGYPRGLSGTDIMREARVFAIADTLDAMTADRPYRRRRSLAEAAAEIRRLAGTQFEPSVVEAFLAVPVAEWERLHDSVWSPRSSPPRPSLAWPTHSP